MEVAQKGKKNQDIPFNAFYKIINPIQQSERTKALLPPM
jgi:hypothetical protein